MSKFKFSLLIMLALVVITATACGGNAPATTEPVPTSVAPTDTPIPPAATTAAVPTTAAASTPSTSSGNLLNGIFGSALDKAKAATTFRMEMQMSAKGALGISSNGTPSASSAPQEIQMFGLKGEVKDTASHFVMQGFITAFLGGDPNKGIEFVALGDKSYVHGPMSLLGAPEDKWYEMPAQQAASIKPPLTAKSFLDSFSESGISASDFTKSGTESLDNRSCEIYSGDKAIVQKAYQSLGKSSGGLQDLANLDNTEFKFWVCDDGYLHQVRLFVEGHETDKPDQKTSILLTMHMYDINSSDIKIEAPANAEPLKAPAIPSLGTPAP